MRFECCLEIVQFTNDLTEKGSIFNVENHTWSEKPGKLEIMHALNWEASVSKTKSLMKGFYLTVLPQVRKMLISVRPMSITIYRFQQNINIVLKCTLTNNLDAKQKSRKRLWFTQWIRQSKLETTQEQGSPFIKPQFWWLII